MIPTFRSLDFDQTHIIATINAVIVFEKHTIPTLKS